MNNTERLRRAEEQEAKNTELWDCKWLISCAHGLPQAGKFSAHAKEGQARRQINCEARCSVRRGLGGSQVLSFGVASIDGQ